jgi:hypothetical protein
MHILQQNDVYPILSDSEGWWSIGGEVEHHKTPAGVEGSLSFKKKKPIKLESSQLSLKLTQWNQTSKSAGRQLFKTNTIDWCEMVSGKNMQPLSKVLKNSLSDCCSALFQCPLEGVFQLPLKPRRSAMRIFPLGTYKVFSRFYDSTDDRLFVMNFVFELVE